MVWQTHDYFPVPPLVEPGLPEFHPLEVPELEDPEPDVPDPLVPELAPPVVPLDDPDPEFIPPLELAPPCPLELLPDCPEFNEFELDPLVDPENPRSLEPPCPPEFSDDPDETLFELLAALLPPVVFPLFPVPLWPPPVVWA